MVSECVTTNTFSSLELQVIISNNLPSMSSRSDSSRSEVSRSRSRERRKGNKSSLRDPEQEEERAKGRPRRPRKNQILRSEVLSGEENFSSQERQPELTHKEESIKFALYDAYLDFLCHPQIKEDRGLVFDVSHRQKLMEHCPRDQKGVLIDWTVEHQWNQANQQAKINKTLSQFGISPALGQGKQLGGVMLEMGCNLAQEFTQQLYNLLVRVYLCLDETQRAIQSQPGQEEQPQAGTERQRLERLAGEVHSNSKGDFFFLSFMFKKHIQLTSKPQKDIKKALSAYQTFVSAIAGALRQIVVHGPISP